MGQGGEQRDPGEGARNEIEQVVLEAVADVLGRSPESISIYDNFFDLGGHSLSATRLVTRLHKTLQVCFVIVVFLCNVRKISLSTTLNQRTCVIYI